MSAACKTRPALRLVDCERLRRIDERRQATKTVAELRELATWLERQADTGRVLGVVIACELEGGEYATKTSSSTDPQKAMGAVMAAAWALQRDADKANR